jgi:hypothetical protein
MGVQNEPIIWYVKVLNFIVRFGIQHMILIGGKAFAQMYIVGITAQAGFVERGNLDCSLFHFFHNSLIRKDHLMSFCSARNSALKAGFETYFFNKL